jgi:hypothetical protein
VQSLRFESEESVMNRNLIAVLACFLLLSFLAVLTHSSSEGYEEAVLASQYSP